MNSFANSLFTVLFGWARALIQRIADSACREYTVQKPDTALPSSRHEKASSAASRY